MSRTRSPLSEEEDLSKLYNDVLAGFASEDGRDSLTNSLGPARSNGATGEPNISSIYAYYSGDPGNANAGYFPPRPPTNGFQGHPSSTSDDQL